MSRITKLFPLFLMLALLLTFPVAALGDDEEGTLISDCASGWHCDGGARYSRNTDDTTDGNACSVATFDTRFFLFFVGKNSASGKPFDLTGAKYIELDLWVDDVNVFRNASDCRMDLGPDANVDNWNVKVTSSTLRSLSLQQGWNHVCLPLSGIQNANYDLTTANVIRFYAIGLDAQAREVRIDNMRAVAEPSEDVTTVEKPKTEPDYYTFDRNAAPTDSTLRRPDIIAVNQTTLAPPDQNAPSTDTPSMDADSALPWSVALPVGAAAVLIVITGVILLAFGKRAKRSKGGSDK
jgi:hypothetical protein